MLNRSAVSVGLVAMICIGFVHLARADELYRINLLPLTHVGEKLVCNAGKTDTGAFMREFTFDKSPSIEIRLYTSK